MKTLTLICIKCGKKQRFSGDPDLIYKKVCAAGWGGCDDICPDCDRDRPEPNCDPE